MSCKINKSMRRQEFSFLDEQQRDAKDMQIWEWGITCE